MHHRRHRHLKSTTTTNNNNKMTTSTADVSNANGSNNLLWKLVSTNTTTNDHNNNKNNNVHLKNDYYILRHGQSLANVAKIIASNPDIACNKYGLSDIGKEQVNHAISTSIEKWNNHTNYAGVKIISSDLLRAKETATILLHGIQSYNHNLNNMHNDNSNNNNYNNHDTIIPIIDNDIVFDIRLRERWFGDYDLTSDTNYNLVWENDAINSSHTIHNVESVNSVMERVTELIVEIENTSTTNNNRYMIILVAHGDVLQILQTAFLLNIPGSQHRTAVQHLDTATLRQLIIPTTTI